MKTVKIFFSILLSVGYLSLLHYSIPTGSAKLPPLGSFLNPFSGFWQNAESSKDIPFVSEQLIGLLAEVNVVFDERAVPHVFAQNSTDMAMVQGYLHARDRLWQMDMTARQASGRLAEVFGERVLEIDQRNRNLGMALTAKKYADEWRKCPDLPILEAYVDGVNQFVEQLTGKDFPIEFKLFNYQPELWSIEKSALVMMSMNLVLCGRNEDLEHTNSLAKIGVEEYEFLFPEWNPKQSPIIPASKEWDFSWDRDTVDPVISQIQLGWIQPSSEGVGSNNWAIHGSRTASGHPVLCSDPHLQLTLPSIWYEMQLASPRQNAYGVSFPGIPQIIIGFNQDIAWGQTNVGMDVSDLYQIKWLDEGQQWYELDGVRQQVEIRIEQIKVRGADPVSDTIKYTYWGPVIEEEGLSLALHWLPNVDAAGCQMGTFIELNEGSNYEDYINALTHFNSPPQNYVFASRHGDIAMKVQGSLPIKDVNQGKFVQNGDSKSHAWKGYINHLETPMIKNPARGFVSSANQHSTDPSYPYFYHGYFEDYRSRSLNDQLEDITRADLQSMQSLQLSTFSRYAADLCPLLLSRIDSNSLSEQDQQLIQELLDWDYCYDANSVAAVGFDLWSEAFYESTWDEFEDSILTLKKPESWRTIQLLEQEPDSKYFDILATPESESGFDLATMTLSQAAGTFDSLVQEGVTWRDYRALQIPHLSRLPAFSEQSVKTGGTSTALNAVSPRNAPSWRMIVELGEEVKAWGVYPGGASGNPGSRFYKTGIEAWSSGSYYALHFMQSSSDLSESQTLLKKIITP